MSTWRDIEVLSASTCVTAACVICCWQHPHNQHHVGGTCVTHCMQHLHHWYPCHCIISTCIISTHIRTCITGTCITCTRIITSITWYPCHPHHQHLCPWYPFMQHLYHWYLHHPHLHHCYLRHPLHTAPASLAPTHWYLQCVLCSAHITRTQTMNTHKLGSDICGPNTSNLLIPCTHSLCSHLSSNSTPKLTPISPTLGTPAPLSPAPWDTSSTHRQPWRPAQSRMPNQTVPSPHPKIVSPAPAWLTPTCGDAWGRGMCPKGPGGCCQWGTPSCHPLTLQPESLTNGCGDKGPNSSPASTRGR